MPTGTIPWITLDDVSVLASYLEQSLVKVLNEKDLPTIGSPKRFDAARDDVVNKLRAACGSRHGNQVSATPKSLPPELKGDACRLILVTMQGACPAIALTDDQKKAFEKSWDVMALIRSGEFFIAMPPDPAPGSSQGFSPVTVVSSSPRLFTRTTLDGL